MAKRKATRKTSSSPAKRTSKKRSEASGAALSAGAGVKRRAKKAAPIRKRTVAKKKISAKKTRATKAIPSKAKKRKTGSAKAGAAAKAARPAVTAKRKKKFVAPAKRAARSSRSVASAKATANKGYQRVDKAAGAAVEPAAALPAVPTVPKTRLTAKRLREFKAVLLERRARMAEDVRLLGNDAFNRHHGDHGDHTTMPIHMADAGSDTWEQEFDLMLMDTERGRLREIDEALMRIDDRTYGVCLATHRPITIARLNAKPWAKFCIEYARMREQGLAS